jgi:hypothetical protein
MKYLLLHDEGDKKKVKHLLDTLKTYCPEVDEYCPGGGGEHFEPVLEQLPHAICIVLYLSQPHISGWINFVAGYTTALKIPLLVYGAAPEKISPLLSKRFIRVKTEDELFGYIGKKAPELIVQEIRSRAKYELLENGIPVNEESLAGCVVGGNLKAVSLFFEAGFSPNTRDRHGVPLLNLAARMGDQKMVTLLLKAGAEVNGQAADRLNTALMDGVSVKNHNMVKDLLAAGTDINLKNRDGQSALILAVGLNDDFLAELFLKAGAAADEPDNLGASGRKYASLFNRPVMTALFERYAPQKNAG